MQFRSGGATTRRLGILTVLAGVVVVGVASGNATAMYHPGEGRFLQRDVDSGAGTGGPARIGTASPIVMGDLMQRDPVAEQHAGGMNRIRSQYVEGGNLYQYVGGRPTTYSDPSGLIGVPGASLCCTCPWPGFFPPNAGRCSESQFYKVKTLTSGLLGCTPIPGSGFPCWAWCRWRLDYTCVYATGMGGVFPPYEGYWWMAVVITTKVVPSVPYQTAWDGC